MQLRALPGICLPDTNATFNSGTTYAVLKLTSILTANTVNEARVSYPAQHYSTLTSSSIIYDTRRWHGIQIVPAINKLNRIR